DFEYVDWALQCSFGRAAHRFTSICLPGNADSWRYLSNAFYDAQLLNMQRLTITVADGLFEGVDVNTHYALALPALTNVKLVAEDGETVEVDVADLNYLVDDMFPVPAGRSLTLELVNVSLTGDRHELSSVFETASTSIRKTGRRLTVYSECSGCSRSFPEQPLISGSFRASRVIRATRDGRDRLFTDSQV
ncbi:hypothetical protein AURDEDRAFT_116991, partial [Auricularia subglabra TFB-10046 SS5]